MAYPFFSSGYGAFLGVSIPAISQMRSHRKNDLIWQRLLMQLETARSLFADLRKNGQNTASKSMTLTCAMLQISTHRRINNKKTVINLG